MLKKGNKYEFLVKNKNEYDIFMYLLNVYNGCSSKNIIKNVNLLKVTFCMENGRIFISLI